MPTYEYKCDNCKITVEKMHSMNTHISMICSKCGQGMQKGFGGGIGVHFKGSGFYETDYKGK